MDDRCVLPSESGQGRFAGRIRRQGEGEGNMALITRRRFVRQTALAAAFYGCPRGRQPGNNPESHKSGGQVLFNVVRGNLGPGTYVGDFPDANQALTTLGIDILTAAGRLCGRVRRSAR